MTLNDIELTTYRRTGYADTPATEVVTRIRQWINIWHQRLLARPGVELLRDTAVSFASTLGQGQYSLPTSVRRVKKIYEAATPTVLRMEERIWVIERDPAAMVTGIPEVWSPISWTIPTLPIAQLSIGLWPIPSSVINYFVDAHILVLDLVTAVDVPLLPFEYHWLLVEAACYEEWMRKADTRSGSARQELETGFKEMRHWLANPRDYKPTNLPQGAHISRLGGWYPHW